MHVLYTFLRYKSNNWVEFLDASLQVKLRPSENTADSTAGQLIRHDTAKSAYHENWPDFLHTNAAQFW